MPQTDLLGVAEVATVVLVLLNAPRLILRASRLAQSWQLRRQIRGTGWADTLEDISAIADNRRNGVIEMLRKVTPS